MYRLNADNAEQKGLKFVNTRNGELTGQILHFGVSAFFRAHLGMYTDAANRKSNEVWGIQAIKTRLGGDKQIEALREQDYLYSLVETGKEGRTVKVISALSGADYYPQEPDKVLNTFTDEKLAVVTTTVTEKGYCFDFAAGDVQWSNDDIQYDLACFTDVNASKRYSTSGFDSKVFYKLRTAIGIISAGLCLRYMAGLPGLTLLCCDNMTDNGKMFQKAVVGFLCKVDEKIAAWAEEKCAFPSAMVDRIVPAMTEDSYKEAQAASGFEDQAAIVCESFAQWVIEDNFAAARPKWELAGAQFVKDVEPFEEMKLRMLNGSHSLIAYIGYLCSYETVDRAILDVKIRNLILSYWKKEAMPTLAINAEELSLYAEKLLLRFANPELKHRTWQIAMDGSQKIPYRWLKGLRVLKEKNLPYDIQALGIAAWIKYTGGVDLNGKEIEVKDPLSEKFRAIHEQCGSDAEKLVAEYLQIKSVFADDLGNDAVLREQLVRNIELINEKGLYNIIGL